RVRVSCPAGGAGGDPPATFVAFFGGAGHAAGTRFANQSECRNQPGASRQFGRVRRMEALKCSPAVTEGDLTMNRTVCRCGLAAALVLGVLAFSATPAQAQVYVSGYFGPAPVYSYYYPPSYYYGYPSYYYTPAYTSYYYTPAYASYYYA